MFPAFLMPRVEVGEALPVPVSAGARVAVPLELHGFGVVAIDGVKTFVAGRRACTLRVPADRKSVEVRLFGLGGRRTLSVDVIRGARTEGSVHVPAPRLSETLRERLRDLVVRPGALRRELLRPPRS